jgi:hypothetical protein
MRIFIGEQCTSKEPVVSAFCIGYVGGAASAMFIAANAEKLASAHLNLGWCPDAPVTAAQMAQVFKNWHDKNPKLWYKDEALGVIASLQEAWPCASY